MEALKDPLHLIKNLADEQGISAGEKARMLALEEEIKMLVGRKAKKKWILRSKPSFSSQPRPGSPLRYVRR